jgi:hypothetical protein
MHLEPLLLLPLLPVVVLNLWCSLLTAVVVVEPVLVVVSLSLSSSV